MTTQPAANDGAPEQVTVLLPHGLTATYTLKAKSKPPPEPEPWNEDNPPPWGPVGFPPGYEEPLPW
ncbi:MAG: hypothetical protein KY440_03415 [Actinobacteria bacterium]|nr:hypothetical protein [Actinomycetota bacterium]